MNDMTPIATILHNDDKAGPGARRVTLYRLDGDDCVWTAAPGEDPERTDVPVWEAAETWSGASWDLDLLPGWETGPCQQVVMGVRDVIAEQLQDTNLSPMHHATLEDYSEAVEQAEAGLPGQTTTLVRWLEESYPAEDVRTAIRQYVTADWQSFQEVE